MSYIYNTILVIILLIVAKILITLLILFLVALYTYMRQYKIKDIGAQMHYVKLMSECDILIHSFQHFKLIKSNINILVLLIKMSNLYYAEAIKKIKD